MDRYKEKGIHQINSCMQYQGPDMCELWSHHLVKFTIIHYQFPKSVCLLRRPNRRAEWGCGGDRHPCILQVLDGGVNLCSSTRDAMLLLMYYFPRQRQRSWFPFDLSHHNSPHCTSYGTSVGILLGAQYVNYKPGTRK